MALPLPTSFISLRLAPDQERKGFLTYSHYLAGAAGLIKQTYGSDAKELYAATFAAATKLTASIGGRQISDSERESAHRNLRGAWNTLLLLDHQANSTDGAHEIKNAWTPVQAWYAVHNALSALIAVQTPTARFKHSLSRQEAAKLITNRQLMPYPWGIHVRSDWSQKLDHHFHGHMNHPGVTAVSNLAIPRPETYEAHFRNLLSTTADQACRDKFSSARKAKEQAGHAARLSAAEKQAICSDVGATTLFDFLYRLRVRANYGDIDTFVIGCSSALEARRFTRDLLIVADTSTAIVEAILMRYLGKRRLTQLLERVAKGHGNPPILRNRLETWRGSA